MNDEVKAFAFIPSFVVRRSSFIGHTSSVIGHRL